MTVASNLLVRAAFGVSCSIATVALASSARIHLPSRRDFDRTLFSAFPILRLALFAVIFFVLKIPAHGDVPAYYFSQAQSVLSGMLPYRDFISSYGPLNSYLNAALIYAWRSPLPLILFATVVESLLLPLWLSAGREFLPERSLRVACAFYLVNPSSLLFCTLDGDNGYLIAVYTALSLWLLVRKRETTTGFLSGVSVLVVKFTSLLYTPIFFFASSRRVRWVFALAVTLFLGFLPFVLKHAPILQPLRVEGDARSSGQLPFLIEVVLGLVLPGRIWDALLLSVLLAIVAFLWFRMRQSTGHALLRLIPTAMVAITIGLMLFSKKTNPAYILQILFPLGLLLARQTRAGFACISVFLVAQLMEASYWYTLLELMSPHELHAALLRHEPSVVLFFVQELVVVAGYAWILRLSLRALAAPRNALDEGSALG